MYAQIFLGITILIIGFSHLLKAKFFLSKNITTYINEEQVPSYQNKIAIPYLLMGVLFITMGIVESKEIMSTFVYVVLYILFAAIPLGLMLLINKRYAGQYTFW